tara:strand:+ start:1270 stop:2322 length:1053 start_codon:yes stop_codon:yes gene_type:complete
MQLKDTLIRQIQNHGPIGVDRFMEAAVSYYYAKNPAIGAEGDFITSPEISQLFGEMIGIWLADCWIKMGQSPSIALLECGPGRGTLMADILRATRHISGFHQALSVTLLEASSAMRERQRQALETVWLGDICWIDSLAEFVPEIPVLIVGNEFLDALPMRQYQKTTDGRWMERVIGWSEEQGFHFGLRDSVVELNVSACMAGQIFEVSPQRENFIRSCADLVTSQGGAGLFIDYGHLRSSAGETLQAVKDHKKCGVFDFLGEADITSHIDFGALVDCLQGTKSFTTSQSVFLQRLGITHRIGALKTKTTPEQFIQLERGFERLVSDTQMGKLFKVFGFCSNDFDSLTGFE